MKNIYIKLALILTSILVMLGGCTTTSYKQQKSPCACDFVIIKQG